MSKSDLISRKFIYIISFVLISISIPIILFQLNELAYNDLSGNIILITIESTRASHLSCYGYQRNTTPNICELAKDGILFENAYSMGTYTLPSLYAIFTSHYPTNIKYNKKIIADGETTLATILQKNGYKTNAFASGVSFTKEKYGLGEGFDTYKWLENIEEKFIIHKINKISKKTFIWFHFSDPHCPYTPPKEFDIYSQKSNTNISTEGKCGVNDFDSMNLSEGDLKYIIDKYDGEIKSVDDKIKKLITMLKEGEIYDDSLIILTADHGEVFNKGGHIGHGGKPFPTTTHVPLIIKFPENTPHQYENKKYKGLVKHLDILPTILDTIKQGNLNKYDLQGKSLLRIIISGASNHSVYYPKHAAIQTKNYFFMKTPLLFINKSQHPIELKNSTIPESLKARFEYMFQRKESKIKTRKREKINISKRMKKQLKRIGYLK